MIESNVELLQRILDREGKPPRKTVTIPLLSVIIVCLLFISYMGAGADVEARTGAYRSLLNDLQIGITFFPEVARNLLTDFARVLKAQVWFGVISVGFAIVPGILGMAYRHAFWPWFLSTFALVFGINWASYGLGIDSVSSDQLDKLSYSYTYYIVLEVVVVVIFLIARLRLHNNPSTSDNATKHKPRNIVVCLDGTWNHPGQRDFGHLAHTNVFKLWWSTKGELAEESKHNANLCKRYEEKQVSFYYHGVGNVVENSALGQAFGGAFGLGAEAIKERAYLDIIRESRPGDRVFIFGFSRGAAIARLVASAVEKRGFPTRVLTLRFFNRMRTVWTSKTNLDSAKAPTIEVLGCWDTVGSFGIAKNFLGIPFQQIDLLKNLTVALAVKRAYHMVGLDETRDAFVPTLMDPDPTNPKRIVEVMFSGNHSNVGGGYATDGLSDLTLAFLLNLISSGYSDDLSKVGDESWGIYLKALDGTKLNSGAYPDDVMIVKPDACGRIRHQTGPIYKYAPRRIPLSAIIHESVFERMKNESSQYAPESIFDLNRRILEQRENIEAQVNKLKPSKGTVIGTATISEDDAKDIDLWRNELTIQLWRKSKLKSAINPEVELANA